MISENNLNKFIELYESKYGVRLKRQDALLLFSRLTRTVKIVFSENKPNLKS